MKTLKEYLIESMSIENIEGRIVVTLVRREGLDLANLSEDDFIKYIKEDFATACKEYDKAVSSLNDKEIEAYRERELKAAEQYAAGKWKTDKKKNEYIDKVRSTVETNIKNGVGYWKNNSSRMFFDLKPDADMGIRRECIIDRDSDDKSLKIAYEEMQKSKFFKKGTGWAFKYWANSKDNLTYNFRPYIDILMDESNRAEQKRDKRNLSAAVDDFYSNTNYWGD